MITVICVITNATALNDDLSLATSRPVCLKCLLQAMSGLQLIISVSNYTHKAEARSWSSQPWPSNKPLPLNRHFTITDLTNFHLESWKKVGAGCHQFLVYNLHSLIPRPRPAFRTASDGKLGGAWERGYNLQSAFPIEIIQGSKFKGLHKSWVAFWRPCYVIICIIDYAYIHKEQKSNFSTLLGELTRWSALLKYMCICAHSSIFTWLSQCWFSAPWGPFFLGSVTFAPHPETHHKINMTTSTMYDDS